MTVQRIVRCPACGGDSIYAISNPYRPFCSERCKDVDLGAWGNEEFRVPERETEHQAPPLPIPLRQGGEGADL